MAKALITTPFPSTFDVARKLGLSDSRVRKVASLMGMAIKPDANERKVVMRKKSSSKTKRQKNKT